jgi:hypothetical protein
MEPSVTLYGTILLELLKFLAVVDASVNKTPVAIKLQQTTSRNTLVKSLTKQLRAVGIKFADVALFDLATHMNLFSVHSRLWNMGLNGFAFGDLGQSRTVENYRC